MKKMKMTTGAIQDLLMEHASTELLDQMTLLHTTVV